MRLARIGRPGAERSVVSEGDGPWLDVAPAGVVLGGPDTPYLRAGEVVEVEIDGLGRQRQRIGQA